MSFDLRQGDVLEVLRTLPDESVHCCVTSPPYWGLRDYGTAKWSGGLPDCDHSYNHGTQGKTGDRADRTFTAQAVYKDVCRKCGAIRVDKQIGLEATAAEFVAKMVEVFSQVKRVLRADGTCWLNLGDSYATGAGAVGNCPGGGKQGERWTGHDKSITAHQQERTGHCGVHAESPKHSFGAIGPKTQPNRMPQEGLKPKDLVGIPWRVAFALQADGWWLRSDIIWAKPAPMPESVTDRPTRSHEYIFLLAKSERYYYDSEAIKEPASLGTHQRRRVPAGWHQGNRLTEGLPPASQPDRKLAKRGSGIKNNESFDAAMAVMPDTRNKRDVWTVNSDPFPEAHFATFPPALILPCVLAGCPEGGIVLDPFAGAATTLLVAQENGRNSIGIELNEDYIEIGLRRLSQMPMFPAPSAVAEIPGDASLDPVLQS